MRLGQKPLKGGTLMKKYKMLAVALGMVVPFALLTGCTMNEVVSSSHPNRIVATFVNYDNTTLFVTSVEYGATATYQGDTPQRPSSNPSYHYTFSGWDKSLNDLVIDTTFIALYDQADSEYTVTFKNYDETVLGTDVVKYGETAKYTGTLPVRPNTEQYSYAFSNWDLPLANITGNCDRVAQFAQTVNTFVVTFKDEDGTILGTDTVEYGGTAEYSGITPTKQGDQQYSYAFSGWSKPLANVTHDYEVVAQYKQSVNQYTVTFKNYDGSVLYTDTVDYGAAAKYEGVNPAKPATAQYSYSFNGWDNDFSKVTSDMTTNALFSESINSYVVTFKGEDGAVLQQVTVKYGETAVYSGTTPTKSSTAQYSYKFTGWSAELTNVVSDLTVTPVFSLVTNQYTVTWVDGNGNTIYQETLDYGATPSYNATTYGTPSKAGTAKYSYTFSSWSPSVSAVKSDTVYTAQFDSEINTYLIKFVNDDGTVLQSSAWEYGSTPVYSGATPTSSRSDEQYASYAFSKWSPTVSPVSGDTTYTAQYVGGTLAKYVIKFVNDDGSELQSSSWDYGSTPSYSGATPTKAKTAQYSYSFSGWDSDISVVKGAKTYTAQYQSAVNSYTITFKDAHGTTFQTSDWPYGSTPSYTGATPTKASDSYTYSFVGWDRPMESVTANAVYYANFDRTWNGQNTTFGKYPQTVVEDKNLISSLETSTDSDGDGYLEYNGNEYYKLTKATPYGSMAASSGNFKFVAGNTYYFKVEPIQWRILHTETGKKLVLSEYVLFGSDFFENGSYDANRTINGVTVYPENYQYSTLRAVLNGYNGSGYQVSDFSSNSAGVFAQNGGFINDAFSATQQSSILSTDLTNSGGRGTLNNTTDKVFALSMEDTYNTAYGFDGSRYTESSTRNAIATDYARATGIYYAASFNESYTAVIDGMTYWMTRTGHTGSNGAVGVHYRGMTYDADFDGKSCIGVRPAMYLAN
jgi:hypothetical protein